MVNYASVLSVLNLILMLNQLLHQVIIFVALLTSLSLEIAFLLFGIADHRSTNGTVVADRSQTPRQEVNGVLVNVNSGGINDAVEEFCPFFVTNSGRTESDNLMVAELT